MSTARFDRITALRAKLRAGQPSVGSWLQIPSPDVAELVASGGFDWVAIDTEHGAVSRHQLPDLMRAIELQGALPLVRVSHPDPRPCQQALDAGAGGVVVPRIEDAATLREIVAGCQWPPAGRRGVGFSRANLFGKHFEAYKEEAKQPLIVAQVESNNAVDNIESLIAVKGVDAVMIGPYDLSASLGVSGEVGHAECRMRWRASCELAKNLEWPAASTWCSRTPSCSRRQSMRVIVSSRSESTQSSSRRSP